VMLTVVPGGIVSVDGEKLKSWTDSAADPLAPAAPAPRTDVPTNDSATAEIANAAVNQIRFPEIRRMVTAYGRGSGRVQPTGAQSEPPPGAGRCRTPRSGVIVTVEPSTDARPSTINE
jgi:hypothetical protein